MCKAVSTTKNATQYAGSNVSQYFGTCFYWHLYQLTEDVQAINCNFVLGGIMVVGSLTICPLLYTVYNLKPQRVLKFDSGTNALRIQIFP